MNSSTPAESICPECGAAILATSPRGLCSRCLVFNSVSLFNETSEAGFSLRSLEELNASFVDFEITRFIGRGGMGAVYEAWQHSLGRTVALKVLPPELMKSRDFFERFQREAQVMARLEHPNVARVYDSGATSNGEAYIVMELISGEPITTFIPAKGLTVKQRLELFVQVCAGVQHAHQKGIIHRDLKPSNILVSEIDGRFIPKVIDFGLAKPVGLSEGDETMWLSASHCIGTPSYMSPEQDRGGEIDSRTDVYSLGVLLYECLAGRPPGKGADSPQTETAIDERTAASSLPSPPSVVLQRRVITTPQGLTGAFAQSDSPPIFWPPTSAKEIHGDLDAIVMKAMSEKPADRYQTVAALPEEINRHLKNLPVLAMRSSARYVTAKFCRRHGVGILVVGAFVILIMAGLGLVLRETMSTRKAERVAAEHLRQGERLIEFMLGDLQAGLQAMGRLDVLERTATEVEAFYSKASATNLAPESLFNRARSRVQLGRIRNAQGKSALAKENYEESIRLFTEAARSRPHIAEWQEELGQAWNSLAIFHHAGPEPALAEPAYRNALYWADRLLSLQSNSVLAIDFKAMVLHNFGAYDEMQGALPQAERKYKEALLLWKPLHRASPDDPTLLDHLSNLYLSLAFVHERRGETRKAKESNAEALRLRERLVQIDPKNTRAVELLADIRQNIAEVHFVHNELADAELWMNQYRPVREMLSNQDPGNASWKEKNAEAWHNYALLQEARTNLPAAAKAHRRCFEILEQPAGQPRTGKFLSMLLENLRAADRIYSNLAETTSQTLDPILARSEWQNLLEIRANIAASDFTNATARLAVGRACLELAALNATLFDDASARGEAQLALTLFKQSLAAGIPVQLPEQEWKTLSMFTGIANGDAASDRTAQGQISISLADCRAINASEVLAALSNDLVKLPVMLASDLRREASAAP